MSRKTTDAQITPNPATNFLKWMNPTEKTKEKGVKMSGFYSWDKEQEKNVMTEFPLIFHYLQDVHGIGGYLEKRKKDIFSNELIDLYDDVFEIKVWNNDKTVDVLKTGYYYYEHQKVAKHELADEELSKLDRNKYSEDDWEKLKNEIIDRKLKEIKAKVNKDGKNGTLQNISKTITGAKRCKIIYGATLEGDIFRLKLIGSNLTAWDDFQKEKNSNKWKGDDKNTQNLIVWKDNKIIENTKQGEDYTVPTFEYLKMTSEQIEENERLYKEQIEPYFNFLYNKPELVVATADTESDNY